MEESEIYYWGQYQVLFDSLDLNRKKGVVYKFKGDSDDSLESITYLIGMDTISHFDVFYRTGRVDTKELFFLGKKTYSIEGQAIDIYKYLSRNGDTCTLHFWSPLFDIILVNTEADWYRSYEIEFVSDKCKMKMADRLQDKIVAEVEFYTFCP